MDRIQYRTVIVLDNSYHSRVAPQPSVRIDIGSRLTAGAVSIARSFWSFQLEACFEYCRLTFDLLPHQAKISVLAANDATGLAIASSWDDSSQHTHKIAHALAAVPKPSDPSVGFTLSKIIPLVASYVSQSLQIVAPDSTRVRVILLSSSSPELYQRQVADLRQASGHADAVRGFLSVRGLGSADDRLETQWTCVFSSDNPDAAPESGTEFTSEGVHTSSIPLCTLLKSQNASTLVLLSSVLARVHFSLRVLKLQYVPLFKNTTPSSELYDIVFLSPVSNHAAECALEQQRLIQSASDAGTSAPSLSSSSSSFVAPAVGLRKPTDEGALPTSAADLANSASGSVPAASPYVQLLSAMVVTDPAAVTSLASVSSLQGLGRYGALSAYWLSLEKTKVSKSMLNCSCSHPVTPLSLLSPIVASIVRYLSAGNTGFLEQVPAGFNISVHPVKGQSTHALVSHSGAIRLHCLQPDPVMPEPFARPLYTNPGLVERLVRTNVLVPLRSPSPHSGTLRSLVTTTVHFPFGACQTTDRAERSTRRVPMEENQTAVFSFSNMEFVNIAGPIIESILPVSILPQKPADVASAVARLHGELSNNTLPPAKLKSLRLFWLELRDMVYAYSDQSTAIELMDRYVSPKVLVDWARQIQEEKADDDAREASASNLARGKRRREDDTIAAGPSSSGAPAATASSSSSSDPGSAPIVKRMREIKPEECVSGFAALDQLNAMTVRERMDFEREDQNNVHVHERVMQSAAPLAAGLLAGPPVAIPQFRLRLFFPTFRAVGAQLGSLEKARARSAGGESESSASLLALVQSALAKQAESRRFEGRL